MAGTTKTRGTLDTNFADNNSRSITPQLLRDLLWSVAMTWRTVTTVTTTYPIVAADDIVLCNHASTAFTVTLPTAVGITGKIYRIKNINTATVTIATTSSQTIDGVTTRTLQQQWQSIDVMSDGANWLVIGGSN